LNYAWRDQIVHEIIPVVSKPNRTKPWERMDTFSMSFGAFEEISINLK